MNATLHAIMGLGVANGAVLWVVLLRLRRFNAAGFSHLLIGLAAVWAIIIEEWFVSTGLWQAFPHIIRSTTWAPFLIGPSLFLFVRNLRRPSEPAFHLLHYAPALIGFLIFLPFYFQTGEQKLAFVAQTHSIPLISSVMGTAKAVSMIGYLVVVRWMLSQFDGSETARLTRWLTRFVTAYLVFLLAIAASFLTEHRLGNLPVSSDAFAAGGSALFIYAISLLVMLSWRDFVAHQAGAGKTSEKLLDDATTERLFEEVGALVVDDELYRSPSLNVGDIARRAGLKQHYLSYVINARSGRNVKAWLNGFRVADAAERLRNEPEKSILTIAFDCGFNSKSAFNRAFKTETGRTPTAFRASHFAKRGDIDA